MKWEKLQGGHITYNLQRFRFGVVCLLLWFGIYRSYYRKRMLWWKLFPYNRLWIQYIPRNMHTVFALLCFVVVIHWLIFPYPSGLLHWHCGNLTIAPVPAKQPWWIWISSSYEFIMNGCITTTKQSTTKPCAYFLIPYFHIYIVFKLDRIWIEYALYESVKA